jgi:hypothetical protein
VKSLLNVANLGFLLPPKDVPATPGSLTWNGCKKDRERKQVVYIGPLPGGKMEILVRKFSQVATARQRGLLF